MREIISDFLSFINKKSEQYIIYEIIIE